MHRLAYLPIPNPAFQAVCEAFSGIGIGTTQDLSPLKHLYSDLCVRASDVE